MIIEVPVSGPQAHLRPLYGAGGRCLTGCNNHCTDMRIHSGGKKSIRVRCRHDAQGRECLELHVCELEHWLPVNTDRFEWIMGESNHSGACYEEVRNWGGAFGRGLGYQHGLFRGGVVCSGDSDDWYIAGPVGGTDWMRKHATGTRGRGPISPSGSNSSGASTRSPRAAASTPGKENEGKRTGRKRLGKKRRDQLRRRLARVNLSTRSSAQLKRAADANTTASADDGGGQQHPSSSTSEEDRGGAGLTASLELGELTEILREGRPIILANPDFARGAQSDVSREEQVAAADHTAAATAGGGGDDGGAGSEKEEEEPAATAATAGDDDGAGSAKEEEEPTTTHSSPQPPSSEDSSGGSNETEVGDSGFERESPSGGSNDLGLVGRDKWVLRSAVEEKGEEGFEPVVRRSSKRLAKRGLQREMERERVQKEAQAKEEARKESLRQHQAMAKAGGGRLGGARQLAGRGTGGRTGTRGKGRTAGGRGRGMHPGRGQGHSAARGGAGGRPGEPASPLSAKIGHMEFEVACGKCGIAKHPQEIEFLGEVFNKCPTSGCHVCCRTGGSERGCTMQGGRAFFVNMLREVYPYNPTEKWVDDQWQSWRTQLGLS